MNNKRKEKAACAAYRNMIIENIRDIESVAVLKFVLDLLNSFKEKWDI